VRELRPAAVTLDIMMPDLHGWTVLAAIKGDPALASTPVQSARLSNRAVDWWSSSLTDFPFEDFIDPTPGGYIEECLAPPQ
jgi:CheY-like chemotaxis protein